MLTEFQWLGFFLDHLRQVVIAYSRSWNLGYNQLSLVLCWSPWRQCMAGAVGWWRKGSATNDGNCERSVLEPEVSHLFASKRDYEVTDKTCTQKKKLTGFTRFACMTFVIPIGIYKSDPSRLGKKPCREWWFLTWWFLGNAMHVVKIPRWKLVQLVVWAQLTVWYLMIGLSRTC